MKELAAGEVYKLEECLTELAAHHNEVSRNFRGQYPKKPIGETLMSFEKDVEGGGSRIAVTEHDGSISGFCKIDIDGADGKIDYLIVLKSVRGTGAGKLLVDWALDVLGQNGVERVEVRVVDGNEAIHFYEKYGFRVNSHILRLDM